MKRWILFGFLLCNGAQAQSWQRLSLVKAGSTIVVDTQPWPYGPGAEDRCELLQVGPDNLTCVDPGRGRLVFPAREVDAVYEVHRSHAGLVAALIALAAAIALMAGGAATSNPDAILLGLGILIVGVWAATGPHLGGPPFAGPPPPPSREQVRLVYLRRAP